MISLKEVKNRILSVISTRKITSAMKMVSSAKLHRAQAAIGNFLPYEKKLSAISTNFLSGGEAHPLTIQREIKKVALVVFSSNSSLCGAFNSNVVKKFEEVHRSYPADTEILIFSIGKKITEYISKKGIAIEKSSESLTDKPNYKEITEFTDKLIELFQSLQIDKVELVYNHFKSAANQVITQETLLPIPVAPKENEAVIHNIDYIIEPDKEKLLEALIPKVIRSKMYGVLLDSVAAEHGARATAMQIATENAKEMIDELTLQYNKARQEVITNEILDIVGGAEASRNS